MNKAFLKATVIAASVICALPAGAAQVSVSGAWFRALPARLPAGGYFTLHNDGAGVQLKSAESPACRMLMLHRSAQIGGMASMMMVESVDIPAGGTIAFSPGGYHLMCTNPTAVMTPGASVPVTLRFNDRTSMTVSFAVRNANGK